MSLPNKKFPEGQKRFRWCHLPARKDGFYFSDVLPLRVNQLKYTPVMDFTGFYDSEGTPVYEDDIMSDAAYLEEYIVYFCKESGAWRLKSYQQVEVPFIDDFLFESVKFCHVIGNLYLGT